MKFNLAGKAALFQKFKGQIPAPAPALMKMRDRGDPVWAFPITLIFTLASAAAVIGIAVSLLFFQSLIAQQGSTAGVGTLTLLACLPVIAFLGFEFGLSRALAGVHFLRDRLRRRAGAAAGALIIASLGVLHPLLAVGPLMGIAVGWGVSWGLKRFSRAEIAWDFSDQEAISILSGRDQLGLQLAQDRRGFFAIVPVICAAATWLSLVLCFAVASWLAAIEVLSLAAIAPIALLGSWAARSLLSFVVSIYHETPDSPEPATVIENEIITSENDEALGLTVQSLTIRNAEGVRLVDNVSFTAAPGEKIGVIGPQGAGKSLLLQALADPLSLCRLNVEGAVDFAGVSLWMRSIQQMQLPAVLVQGEQKIVAGTGRDNLGCFAPQSYDPQIRRCLETLVFSVDAIDEILTASDARNLSSTEQRAIEFARALFLAPNLYLFDRPEDRSPEQLLRSLSARLDAECKAGRTAIFATDNRLVLESCDKLLVMQDGRMIDFGPAAEIRERQSTGWARFCCEKRLESEEMLENWMRGHFKRAGDEGNRRNVCTIAAEFLAFACGETAGPVDETIKFDFKHFTGHCILRLSDQGELLSSGRIQRAQRDAQNDGAQRDPLARILQNVLSMEQSMKNGSREITLQIATYDPRQKGGENLRQKTAEKAK